MDEKVDDKNQGSKLSIIGPVVGLAAAIIMVFGNLPATLRYIMLFLLAVIAVLSIYVILGPLFVRSFQRVRNTIKDRLLVSKYLNQFSLFVDRFCELAQNDRSDNLMHAFRNFECHIPEFNYPHSLMCELSNFVPTFKKWVEEFRKHDFELLISWFEFVLRIYHRQLLLEPLRQLRIMDQNQLTKDDMECYEKNREHYVRFLQDYVSFARELNRDAGKNVAQHYFDLLGKLMNGYAHTADTAPSQS